ncbi:MAG: hypothetical protein WKF62_00780 [Solirubrobacterales bacterium]
MGRDPYNPSDDRALGLAVLGAIAFCAASGTGVGVFLQAPALGGIAGGVVGIIVGLLVVPGLMRDWRD